MRGITETGFEFEIDDEVLDDYEVMEDLCALDCGKVAIFPQAIEKILGKEQLIKLKDHVRNDKGKVSTTALMKEFTNILNSNQPGKNS